MACALTAAWVLLALLATTASGFPTGAGGCIGDGPAVGDSHLTRSLTTGSLANGGLAVYLDGVALDPHSPHQFEIGVDHELTVFGEQFRGVLLRLESTEGITLSDVLLPGGNLRSADDVCSSLAVGVTHLDSNLKNEATSILRMDELAADLRLDVTVVSANTFEGSKYYYTQFELRAVADAVQTSFPTMFIFMPDDLPVEVPSFSPTNEPATQLNVVSSTVVETIQNEPDLFIFSFLLNSTNVLGDLAKFDQATVFAPSDEAFLTFDGAVFARLQRPEWINHLIELLAMHVTEGSFVSNDLINGTQIEMLDNQFVEVTTTEDIVLLKNPLFGSVTLVELDLIASNGAVHKIDSVMRPIFFFIDLVDAFSAEIRFFSTLIELVTIAGLENTLRNDFLTLLAPINSAFNALPNGRLSFLKDPENLNDLVAVLQHHILPSVVPSALLSDEDVVQTANGDFLLVTKQVDVDGQVTLYFDQTSVLLSDGLARNGLGYALTEVLIPPLRSDIPSDSPSDTPSDLPSDAPSDFPSDRPSSAPFIGSTGSPIEVLSLAPSSLPIAAPAESVLTVLQNDPELSVLLSLMNTSGIIEPLSTIDPLTVFAPDNAAFETIDQEFLERIQAPEWIGHLVQVLSLHVSFGNYQSSTLTDGLAIEMLNFEEILVNTTETAMLLQNPIFGSVAVTELDLKALNGVVHKIDAPMLPVFVFFDLLDQYASERSFFSTFLNLVTMAGLEETIRGGFYTVLAPTNAAFEALPEAAVSYLTSPNRMDLLREVLLYHVIPGVFPSTFLEDGQALLTAQGSVVVATLTFGPEVPPSFRFNQADVIIADGLANNGLGFAISDVLIPDGIELLPVPPSGMPSRAITTLPTAPLNHNSPSAVASQFPTAYCDGRHTSCNFGRLV